MIESAISSYRLFSETSCGPLGFVRDWLTRSYRGKVYRRLKDTKPSRKTGNRDGLSLTDTSGSPPFFVLWQASLEHGLPNKKSGLNPVQTQPLSLGNSLINSHLLPEITLWIIGL